MSIREPLYGTGADRVRARLAEQASTLAVGALPRAGIKPDDLDTAVRVARYVLATYGDVGRGDIYAYAQAHGGLAEALRILLRALDAEPATRCPAAHPEDPTPCRGPVVVTVLDAMNAGANGCEHHGARLLASLDGGCVYPLPDAPDGAAIRVFRAAGGIRPFPWLTNAPRTEPSQLSRDEQRARGEGQ
ncbi:hypothetical protein ACIBL8_44115 [Streptomyces sp. NPDC050523]|uniref:hypothetical protein n=1 Tax=Streptomyces sp. NPDC050523 TaxID=3365622 RepID=UPI0037AC98B3